MNFYDTRDIPCFGIAGNFTGHLEQAGEAADFKNVKTLEQNAPKAIFPTFLPKKGSNLTSDASVIPEFLTIFPFDPKRIIFPKDEEKLQIEPECAIIFNASWEGDTLTSMTPVSFGASNDCSIRKQGAKKISEKKNWGVCTKGFSENQITADGFEKAASWTTTASQASLSATAKFTTTAKTQQFATTVISTKNSPTGCWTNSTTSKTKVTQKTFTATL